ncbi:Oxysterol-binding protein-like protein 1 [Psilocybe cubensis]|uniref:Oxysterol-binding protein-like protein 1 n=2 Tax=Psilocybe cubensis TaxID=181762 RepID=A0ACB8GPY2_PSICU|nr:Oxysterol-binding protein-like protein 1 [Psilocybe cubensis]KAH9477467.1 Oxysterol-binding protein-like protein 1 [Psilocybe cubensis]
MSTTQHDNSIDEDAPGPPISVPDSGDTGEGGKLKMIVQLVKKCLGVKDIATMRLSLPASLLEPMPNLEYWHYLDRPDIFCTINDSDDPFMRMISVLRFTFTKDIKFIHGKVCKPYNSVLGEHFRAHWDVEPNPYRLDDGEGNSNRDSIGEALASETGSVKSGKSSKSTTSGISAFSKHKSPSTAPTSPHHPAAGGGADTDNLTAQVSSLSLGGNNASTPGGTAPVRVVFLTEQVSHHPPVSAYFATCPSRSIEMSGIDQISAKVSGTTLRVSPGQYNQGIFIHLTGGPGEGEKYHITHPVASVNGILRGSFYVTVGESTIITCEGGKPGHKFRTIIEYKEESWLGRAHFLVEGVIHTVFDSDTTHCAEWTKVKHVPQNRVVAVFDGSWRGKIRWKRVGTGSYPNPEHNHTGVTRSTASSPNPSHAKLPMPNIPAASVSKADVASYYLSGKRSSGSGSGSGSSSKSSSVAAEDEWMQLMDLSTLFVVPKTVRPLERQHSRESRKLWENVTDKLMKKEFSEATKEKVAIEQRQRDEAAERKKKGIQFVPRYFENDLERGYAVLTEDGKVAVEEEMKEDTPQCIEGIDVNAQLSS